MRINIVISGFLKLILLCLAFGVPLSSSAGVLVDTLFNNGRVQWPARTAPKGTLEYQLDPVFEQFSVDCGVVPYDNDISKSTFIPKNLRSESLILGLQRSVITVSEDSAKRLMAFLFSEENIRQIKTALRIDPTRFLITDVDDLNLAPVPREGSDTLGYKHTCSSFLNAALEANLRLPVVSLSSAVKAETTETSNLIIVRGTFENPVFSRYRALDPQTLLEFWTAYANAGEYSSKLKIIKGFDGVVLIRVKTSDRRVDFKLGAQVGATSPIFNGSLSTAAGLNNESALRAAQYTTYIFEPPNKDVLFGSVPTPSEIQDAFGHVERAISFGERKRALVFPAVPFQATVELKSIPVGLCTSGNLRVVTKANNFPLRDAAYEVKPIVGSPGSNVCRVTLTGFMSDAVVPPTNIRLDYTISSREVRNVDNATTVTLSLPISIDVRASNHPSYRPPPNPVDGRKIGNTYEWTYFADFLETDRSLDRSRLAEVNFDGTAQILCKGNKVNLQTILGVVSGRIQLTLQGDLAGLALNSNDVCTADNLTLNLPAVGATELIPSPVVVQLRVP